MPLKHLSEDPQHSGSIRLAVSHDMTIYAIEALKHELSAEIAANDAIELALADVEEFDSAGLQLLLALQRELTEQGKGFHLISASNVVTALIASYGLDQHLPVRAAE